jgi:hypothetical protein
MALVQQGNVHQNTTPGGKQIIFAGAAPDF